MVSDIYEITTCRKKMGNCVERMGEDRWLKGKEKNKDQEDSGKRTVWPVQ
jgi:hypothetical protein